MPLAGADLFRPRAAMLLPDLIACLRSRAGLVPATYRIIAAALREADEAGVLREADEAGVLSLPDGSSPVSSQSDGDEGPHRRIGEERSPWNQEAMMTEPAAAAAAAAATTTTFAQSGGAAEAGVTAGLALRQSCWQSCHDFLQDVLMSCHRYRVRSNNASAPTRLLTNS